MKDILILFLALLCLVNNSEEITKFINKSFIETKKEKSNFSDTENDSNINITSLENIYDLNINEKKKIEINNLSQFVFILKNSTTNSEINLNIYSNGNNIQFENIKINDKEFSNINNSKINNFYFNPKNKTVKIEIKANLINKERKDNSFYISLSSKNDGSIYFIWIIRSIAFVLFIAYIGIFCRDDNEKFCEVFKAVFCCCCVKKRIKYNRNFIDKKK